MDVKLDELGALFLLLFVAAVASTVSRGLPRMRVARFAPPTEAAAEAFTRELSAIARAVWHREHAREALDAS